MAADAGRPAPAAAGSSPPPALERPLPFRLLPTAPSSWDPASASVTLNERLDGCIVPSEASEQGARIAYSHAGLQAHATSSPPCAGIRGVHAALQGNTPATRCNTPILLTALPW